MVGSKMRFCKTTLALLIVLLFGCGCVYYNTFYYAKKNFNDAESGRKKAGTELAGPHAGKYRAAVEKALKVLTDHPNSKYVDDALYIIGKSYYHMGDYSKAERKFRELLAAYPKSEFKETSLFYLGKCRLMQEEYILARQAFITVDSMTKNRNWKAEAQYMLGEIEFKEENYAEAVNYYSNYLDKYSSLENAAKVQYQIGESYALLDDYESAKNAYLAVSKHDPDDSLYYRSQFKAGEAYYMIGQIDSGYAIFEGLANNEKYYKNAGEIRLKLAEGLSIKGNLEGAIEEYQGITQEFTRTAPAAVAYFEMGEIYMLELSDLETAKAMYDSSKSSFRGSEVYQTAAERSANIGKLSQYRELVTSEDLEAAAQSQYHLAELFLFELSNPDTAMTEFKTLIDSFPESDYAAKAHLARGYIFEKLYDQPDSAENEYRTVMENFASTDFIEDAALALQIDLDTTDIDYPGRRYKNAETLLFDEQNVDSALVVFQSILDDFPNSKYAPKAAFAKVRLMEIYSPPAEYNPDDSTFVPDSTLILAYKNIADTYQDTEFADSALSKLGQKATRRPKPQQPQPEQEEPAEEQYADIEPDQSDPATDSLNMLNDIFGNIEALIDTLHEIKSTPLVIGEFIYPPSAYYTKWEGYIGFAVMVDALGKPSDWHIIQGSGVKDIDDAAFEAIRYTEFNTSDMDLEYLDQWQFYRIRVELPRDVKGYE
jgi:TonB family protein